MIKNCFALLLLSSLATACLAEPSASPATAKTSVSTYAADGFAADCTPGIHVDADQQQRLVQIEQAADAIAVPTIVDPANVHQYLVLVALDGTNNHGSQYLAASLKKPGWFDTRVEQHRRLNNEAFQPDKCLGLVRAPRAGDRGYIVTGYPSNPTQLYRSLLIAQLPRMFALYEPGVGTEPNSKNLLDTATGASMKTQVDNAYRQILALATDISARDPAAEFVFVTTGFSRGASAARWLNNLLLDKGIGFIAHDDGAHAPAQKIPFRIGVSVLFDSVSTQFLQHTDPRHFRIDPRVKQVLHLTAENEYRPGFPLHRALEGNVVNLSFPGAHSDIGGTYSADGISALTLQIAYHYLNRAGIPIAHEALTHEFHPDPAKFIIHDSRYLGWSKFQAQLRQPRAHADTQLPTHRISAPPG